eukprot:3698792-Pleurochrysis_carterae.AAC.6
MVRQAFALRSGVDSEQAAETGSPRVQMRQRACSDELSVWPMRSTSASTLLIDRRERTNCRVSGDQHTQIPGATATDLPGAPVAPKPWSESNSSKSQEWNTRIRKSYSLRNWAAKLVNSKSIHSLSRRRKMRRREK